MDDLPYYSDVLVSLDRVRPCASVCVCLGEWRANYFRAIVRRYLFAGFFGILDVLGLLALMPRRGNASTGAPSLSPRLFTFPLF